MLIQKEETNNEIIQGRVHKMENEAYSVNASESVHFSDCDVCHKLSVSAFKKKGSRLLFL